MSKLSPASRIQANLEELFQGEIASGDAYIKFQLTPNIQALLSMKQVQESLIINAETITPLPGMPASTIGMINSRDRVFFIFDLAQLLKISTTLAAPRQYQTIVVQTTTEPQIQFGLAVRNLQGIIRLKAEQIRSSTEAIDSNLIPYSSGVIVQQESKLPLLQLEKILEALKSN